MLAAGTCHFAWRKCLMKLACCLRLMICLAVVGGLSAPLGGYAQMKPAPTVDPARGQQIASQVCAACHGADGNSTVPANPRLAQQHSDYLYKQLLDYTVRQGQQRPARENAIMNGFASQLSDEDKRNVSAWFAGQTAQLSTARNKQIVGSWAANLARRIARKIVAGVFGLPQSCGTWYSESISATRGAARRVRRSDVEGFSSGHASQ